MSYDPNFDYKKFIDDLKAQGVPDSDPRIIKAAQQRQEKINAWNASNAQKQQAWGASAPVPASQVGNTPVKVDTATPTGDLVVQQPAQTAGGQQTGSTTGVPASVTTDANGIVQFNPGQMGVWQDPNADATKKIFDDLMNSSYNSPFAAQIKDIADRMGSRSFSYNPDTDPVLQADIGRVTNIITQQMNARGLASSSINRDTIAQNVTQMIGQYRDSAMQQFNREGDDLYRQFQSILGLEQQDYAMYQDTQDRKYKALTYLNNLSEQDFVKWKDARDQQYQMAKDTYDATIKSIDQKRAKVQDARERVSDMGYVDNEASIVLGVPVGTLSKEAREAAEKRKQFLDDREADQKFEMEKIDKQYKQAQALEGLRHANSMKEAEVRASTQNSITFNDAQSIISSFTNSLTKPVTKTEFNPATLRNETTIVQEPLDRNSPEFIVNVGRRIDALPLDEQQKEQLKLSYVGMGSLDINYYDLKNQFDESIATKQMTSADVYQNLTENKDGYTTGLGSDNYLKILGDYSVKKTNKATGYQNVD
jgi:hypothetical protein